MSESSVTTMNHGFPYGPGTPLPESDLYAACKDFILTFALPALAPDQVFQGWHDRDSLPTGNSDYAVVSALSAAQHGTSIEKFSAPFDSDAPGELNIQGLYKIGVRLDFCGQDDLARQRSQRAALMARSSVGADFFKSRGFSLLYADDIQEEKYPDNALVTVRRYFTTIRLAAWSGVSVECDYFDKASLSRVENVMAHHHPNQQE